MANARIAHLDLDGSTDTFDVTFDYISKAHVIVKIDGSATTAFTWLTDSRIQMDSMPASGSNLIITRESSPTTRLVDYQTGSILSETVLDTDSLQAFYLAQEANDVKELVINVSDATNQWDGQNKRITNVSDPTAAQDAVTKNYLENTWLSTTDKANITTLSGLSDELGRLGTADAVADLAIVGTADFVADLNTVASADFVADLNTVASADFVADLNTVASADFVSDLNDVAAISSDVAAVADISADVTAVAGDATDIGTVATDLSGGNTIGTVAGIAANVTTVAGISSDVTAVAGDATDIGTVAADLAGSDTIGTVAGVAANVTTVAGVATDVTTVAGISADVTTAATNVADITNFADVYIGPSASDPTQRADTSALQAGDLYFNTGSNSMKVYNGSSWDSVSVSAATVVSKTSSTGSAVIPVGSTGDRDGSPSTGFFRYNTTESQFEGYDGSAWGQIGGGAGYFKGENGTVGSSAGDIFRVNEQELNTDVTIASTENASATGPLSVASGTTLTVDGNLSII
jgi:hypothetical protein